METVVAVQSGLTATLTHQNQRVVLTGVDDDERPVRITLNLAEVDRLHVFVSQIQRGPQ